MALFCSYRVSLFSFLFSYFFLFKYVHVHVATMRYHERSMYIIMEIILKLEDSLTTVERYETLFDDSTRRIQS